MNKLLQKYLNSVAVFEAPNDKGRPEIKVDVVDNREDKNNDAGNNKNENEKKEEQEEQEGEDENEDDEDNDNNQNETDEEKQARLANQKEERRQARIQKRIDKLVAENKNSQTEIAKLKKQLEEKPVEGLTEEEVERRAEDKAAKKLKELEVERENKQFEKLADKLIKSASKVDKDFEKKINEVAKETDTLMQPFMLEILSDEYDNGHEILTLMANDADLYEEICTMSERKMIRRFDKLSAELKSRAKKPQQRERERLPDPITPINDGTNNRGNSLPSKPTENMEDFVRIRAQQVEAFRKSRGH